MPLSRTQRGEATPRGSPASPKPAAGGGAGRGSRTATVCPAQSPPGQPRLVGPAWRRSTEPCSQTLPGWVLAEGPWQCVQVSSPIGGCGLQRPGTHTHPSARTGSIRCKGSGEPASAPRAGSAGSGGAPLATALSWGKGLGPHPSGSACVPPSHADPTALRRELGRGKKPQV